MFRAQIAEKEGDPEAQVGEELLSQQVVGQAGVQLEIGVSVLEKFTSVHLDTGVQVHEKGVQAHEGEVQEDQLVQERGAGVQDEA